MNPTFDIFHKTNCILEIELKKCDLTKDYPYVKEAIITKRDQSNSDIYTALAQILCAGKDIVGITILGTMAAFDKESWGELTQDDVESMLEKLSPPFSYTLTNPDALKEPPLLDTPGRIY